MLQQGSKATYIFRLIKVLPVEFPIGCFRLTFFETNGKLEDKLFITITDDSSTLNDKNNKPDAMIINISQGPEKGQVKICQIQHL